jgi:hypothetical protein
MSAMKEWNLRKEPSELEQCIALLNNISSRLERIAENEKTFGIDMCLELEKFSWESYKMANNIQEIQQVYGG